MKILMFGWEFPPYNSGGLGVACEGLAKELGKRHSVTFVLPRTFRVKASGVRFIFADQVGGVPVVDSVVPGISAYINTPGYLKWREAHPDAGFAATLVEEVIRYGRAAEKIAESEEHDIIHVHDWLCIPAGLAAKRKSGKPLVVHVHATEYDRTGGRSPNSEIFSIEKQGLESADMVVAVSGYTKRIIMQEYGIAEAKIKVVHNGLERQQKKNLPDILSGHKKRGGKVVLFLGRITLQKGPDYFLKVAARVLSYNKNIVFVMAGSGDMEGKMMELASELGIAEHVVFTGFARGEDTERLYKSADIFVLPSVSEPFGITPLEAIQYDTPVIISKQSGVSEVVTHAIKTDFWDIDEMANAILCMAEYPELYHEIKEQSGRELSHITWEKSVQTLMDCYRTLMATPSFVGICA